MDLIWLQRLGEIAGQHGLIVRMDRDPQTGEIWLKVRPEHAPNRAGHGGTEQDQERER